MLHSVSDTVVVMSCAMRSYALFIVLYYAAVCEAKIQPKVQPDTGQPYLAPITSNEVPDDDMRRVYNHEFSVIHRPKICDQSDSPRKYVQVWFTPGRTVELKCAACNVETVYDGSAKVWRMFKRESIAEAFTTRVEEKQYWMEVKDYINAGQFEPRRAAAKADHDVDMRVFQRDGRLYIIDASFYMDSVFNCFPESYTSGGFEILYVLSALMPPQSLYSNYQRYKPEKCTEPDPRIHYYKSPDAEDDFHDLKEGLNYYWHLFEPIYLKIGTEEEVAEITQFKLPAEAKAITDLGLQVSFVWSEWSHCTGCKPQKGIRKREGRCKLKMTGDSIGEWDDDDMNKYYKWSEAMDLIRKPLEKILSHSLYRENGIDCFNSIIATAMENLDCLDAANDIAGGDDRMCYKAHIPGKREGKGGDSSSDEDQFSGHGCYPFFFFGVIVSAEIKKFRDYSGSACGTLTPCREPAGLWMDYNPDNPFYRERRYGWTYNDQLGAGVTFVEWEYCEECKTA